jgi:two-component system chemotaxis sensor kinase CheA
MDKSQLAQRLMATFLEELEEHVRSLNRDLLALEKQTGREGAEALKSVFRAAHSLKGAARAVNLPLIEQACHRLEELLTAVRDHQRNLEPDLFSLLFATVDGFEEAGMRLREQQDLSASPLAALLGRLDAAVTRGCSPVLPPAPAHRTATPPPDDRVADDSRIHAPTLASSPTSPSQRPATAPSNRPVPASEVTPDEPAFADAPAASLRVTADKLDALLARTGELLIARRRVESRLADLDALREFVEQWEGEWQFIEKAFDRQLESGAGDALPRRAVLELRQAGTRLRHLDKELGRLKNTMHADSRLLEQVAAPLEDEVRHVRMLPFAEACAGLERMVRDLTRAVGKDAELVLEGTQVALDRAVLEGLKDPLRHLVRNAIDHGLEPPDQRRRAGKPPTGRILIAAHLRGGQVEVAVQDDGRGLDLEALRAQARRRDLPGTLSESELVNLVFLPGFSTSAIITDVSGRGVGLDVVKSRLESLHGTVDLSHRPGAGTRFTLTVPLTLTTLRAVLVQAAGQTYAFSTTNVHRFLQARVEELRPVGGRDMLPWQGALLPFARLAAVLQPRRELESLAGGAFPVLVVTAGESRMALAVDAFLAEQEILIKSLGPRLRRTPMTAGATLLPSGRIALVLNAAHLLRAALRQGSAVTTGAAVAKPAPVGRKRLLVVEDSLTTRALEKSILEAAGYEVATAVDGQAAWEYLQDHEPDLVVSDVEMPRLDGFELAARIRASRSFHRLPVVLVTARASEADRARGIEVGADAYLLKGTFDQSNLLETIAQLL